MKADSDDNHIIVMNYYIDNEFYSMIYWKDDIYKKHRVIFDLINNKEITDFTEICIMESNFCNFGENITYFILMFIIILNYNNFYSINHYLFITYPFSLFL